MRQFITTALILICSLLLLTVCGDGEAQAAMDEIQAVPVNAIVVGTGTIERTIKLFGNIQAEQSVTIISTITNRIIKINADIGDAVFIGDVLAVIDDEKIIQAFDQAAAGLETAQAQYLSANAEWERVQKLYQEKVVSQSHYEGMKAQRDAAYSNVKQMKAVLSSAQSQLRDTEITSPISGVISFRGLDVGDMAAPQIPLFKVVTLDPIKVNINVIERNIGIITEGLEARVTVSSFPDTVFIGTVEKVNPTLNPMSRSANAEIILANTQMQLKPGMFANVEVLIESHGNSVIIPKYTIIEKTALDYEEGRLTTGRIKVNKSIFVIQDSIALKRDVMTGFEQNNQVEILSGLEAGEILVTQGHHQLIDSSNVIIISE
jgi:RND family efflux transporter MFP subunit